MTFPEFSENGNLPGGVDKATHSSGCFNFRIRIEGCNNRIRRRLSLSGLNLPEFKKAENQTNEQQSGNFSLLIN